MTLLEFLNPSIFWRSLTLIVKNIRNRNFYINQMLMLNRNGSLSQVGMRLDMRRRAYYVLNLEPESLMMGTEVMELERSRVLESINSKKLIFETAELTELIEAKTERIKTKDYYAYLIQIKYRPLAGFGNWAHVLAWLNLATVATVYIIKAVCYRAEIAEWIKSIVL